jgi:O-antigen/teichoic acid export membrane protein
MHALLFSAAPLGITAAMISLTTNIPRYVILAVYDEHVLGLFASVAVVLQAGSLVFRAVEQPAIPRLARLLERRDASRFWTLINRLFGLFLVIGLIACMLSLLFGPALLNILFNNKFKTMGGVLAMMTLAAAIGQIAGMIESSLIAARLTAVQIPMHCVTALSCLFLCHTLVPPYGLYGAVLAVTVCRFPFMLIGVLLLRQKLAQPPNETDFKSNIASDVDRDDMPKREAA